jgi:hypothetical protein
MTVATVATTQRFNGNGSQTSFSFAYPYFANTDFKVYVNDVLQTLTTHYSVNATGALSEGKYPGANIVFVTAPVAGSLNVRVSRRVTAVQNTDISNITQLNMTDVETTLDKVVIIAQDSVDNANQVVDSAISAAVTAAEAAIVGDVSAAAASAASASSSASTATTQAGIATTQASNASGSASSASTSATLAGNYASYSEDNLVPGGSGYSALHWRNKAEDQYLLAAGLIDAIDDLTAGVYLAWESRTANFTAVYGGRYFADTTSSGITVTLPSSPSILTEVEIFTNATDDNPLTISNSPVAVSGYETNPLIITRVGFLKLKYDPVLTKWVWLNYSEAPKRFRQVATNLTAGSGTEVRPGDYVYVDSTSGARSIDAPYGTNWPEIGDEFTIVDHKGTFATNNCTIVFNPKKLEGVAQNLVINKSGDSYTFRYIDDTTGWTWLR